jgi:hypothetical protein
MEARVEMSAPADVLECTVVRADGEIAPGAAGLITVAFRFNPSDPFAVSVFFEGTRAEWFFSRALLTEGLLKYAGRGDVEVFPRDGSLHFRFTSPGGEIHWVTNLADVDTFLTNTYLVVPQNGEVVDWDSETRMMANWR